MMKSYRGRCHCGAVQFAVRFDISNGTSKCNCMFCWKTRNWNVGGIKPDDFELISGQDSLSSYGRKGPNFEVNHRFCSKCGTPTHGDGFLEQVGGAFVAVRVAALDNLDVADLVSAPTKYCDGLNDSWWTQPSEIRHL